MQTKYEQITELRETATLINQLEFKIQFNSNSIEQLTKYNSHKENTDLINELTAITDKLKTELKKGNTTTALDLLTPEERIMKGVHYGLDEHGRYKFLDMEINEMRVVDPRTIKYLILKNTKYLIK